MARGQPFDHHRQPARRTDHLQPLAAQPQIGQKFGHGLVEVGQRGGHIVRGQFLGADFQHKCGRLGNVDGRCFSFGRCGALGHVFEQGEAQLLALGDEGFGHAVRHTAHAAKVGGAFGHADSPTGIEDVERVRTFEHVIVSRHYQPGFQAAFALGFVKIVGGFQRVNIGHVKVVFAVFNFLAQQNVAVSLAAVPIDVPHALDALQIHGDALQPVGQLDRNGVEHVAAGLLEIGVLADFHAIEPDFPAQPPRAERRTFPVVFHKADVVLFTFQADGVQAAQVQFLRVAGVRLQNDLVLVVHLHAVGVVAKTAVVGAERWFNVANVPRFRAEYAQSGAGVGRAGAHGFVPGLPDERAVAGPVVAEFHQNLLEV